MKNTLESGDLFIIDEPAAMLHPLAQKEVLKELLELERSRYQGNLLNAQSVSYSKRLEKRTLRCDDG